MRIGFDATNILGHGGIKTYARELIRGLAEEYIDDTFVLLTTFSGSKKRALERLFADLPNVTVHKALPHRNMLGNGLSFITKYLSSIFWWLFSRDLDTVHLTDPFGVPVLPKKFVATINDIFPLALDESSGLKNFYLKRTPEILEKASAVITPSIYIKDMLADYYPESDRSIKPIPDAASDEFHPRSRSIDILNRYGLDEKSYFLFVGRVDARKNIPGIITAYLELPEGIRSSTCLALVLSGRPPDIDDFMKHFAHLLEGNGIIYLRDVPPRDLFGLYSSALGFVFPTLDEGFGLPVLEAMQSGCPVISSNLSCIPEIAGNAAILVDPLDTSEISLSMRLLAESPRKRDELSKKGLQQSRLYSWRRTAMETMEIYRSVVR